MHTNKVSVIIPLYNRHFYADRAIKSVLGQSFDNWELFIVDDNSDIPYMIPVFCEKIKNKITLIRNKINLGPGLSRQKGLDLAQGEFVCFLDSDDYWKSDFLRESIKAHSENPGICATYCQSEMTDGTLRRRNELNDAVDDIFYGVVSGVRPWATCSIMWKKKYLAKWNPIRTNQDAMFELETALINPQIRLVSKILCVIDKESGLNSEDLVKKSKIEKNRNNIIIYAAQNIYRYRGNTNVDLLKRVIWNRLNMLTIKQFKYKNYFTGFNNIIFLIKRLRWYF
jgi:glycosyltransferase involved in cell wall biosynthesis